MTGAAHGDTLAAELEMVPFPDGTNPTLAPVSFYGQHWKSETYVSSQHELSALTSLNVITGLSHRQRDWHFVGYALSEYADGREATGQ